MITLIRLFQDLYPLGFITMKLRVQLQCKNLHEYLRELSPEILDRLYNHPATCLAVYRELPSLAKNYVMRMLFLDQPLPQAAVALWVKKDSQNTHRENPPLKTQDTSQPLHTHEPGQPTVNVPAWRSDPECYPSSCAHGLCPCASTHTTLQLLHLRKAESCQHWYTIPSSILQTEQ
ncbi:general transcription and DNA repair factor IIH subunit TFB2-like [Morone saxatilis]|uniref:general transcription and DNA repair factor IIH subunit TFB2-like n=1 Tax=Morone saxatilis TaxID=34816 RepID=UPI0015E1DFAB|nr:general transcription and DNA repair factor IIH subunit TFB2-like [Morone saxatilis]